MPSRCSSSTSRRRASGRCGTTPTAPWSRASGPPTSSVPPAASTSCRRRCCATARSGPARCSCGSARSRGSPSRSSTSPRRTRCPTGGSSCSRARRPGGRPVVVSHSPEPALRTVAVFDAVLNNSDRKGSHLLRDGDVVRGCDHGVSLGVEPKLRTVLWGWAGEPVPDADLARLDTLLDALGRRARRRARDAADPRRGARPAAAHARRCCASRRHPVPQPGLARDPVAGPVDRCHVVLPGEVVARSFRPRRARPR